MICSVVFKRSKCHMRLIALDLFKTSSDSFGRYCMDMSYHENNDPRICMVLLHGQLYEIVRSCRRIFASIRKVKLQFEGCWYSSLITCNCSVWAQKKMRSVCHNDIIRLERDLLKSLKGRGMYKKSRARSVPNCVKCIQHGLKVKGMICVSYNKQT